MCELDEKANLDINREIQSDNAFELWFEALGYDEDHKEMFRTVWMSAVVWHTAVMLDYHEPH